MPDPEERYAFSIHLELTKNISEAEKGGLMRALSAAVREVLGEPKDGLSGVVLIYTPGE